MVLIILKEVLKIFIALDEVGGKSLFPIFFYISCIYSLIIILHNYLALHTFPRFFSNTVSAHLLILKANVG